MSASACTRSMPGCYYCKHVIRVPWSLITLRDLTTHTHTTTIPLSGTTRVSQYQKKHSPTHHPDHDPIFISFFHLPRSIASSLFKLRAWQSFCTTSFHVLFGLPLGLEPSSAYSMHFFTQSVSSFRSTCPYHLLRALANKKNKSNSVTQVLKFITCY